MGSGNGLKVLSEKNFEEEDLRFTFLLSKHKKSISSYDLVKCYNNL